MGKKEKDPGEVVPGYQMLDVIGKGGMGAVFRAREKKTDQEYAIKILYPKKSTNTRIVNGFQKEGELLSKIDHENIVRCHEHGRHQNLLYQVLDLVDGKSLRDLLEERGTFDEEEAFDIAYQIAKSLRHLQQNDIVHRDVKPDNVIMNSDGKACLCDLGLSVTGGEPREESEDMTVGTSWYIAPEQARGDQNLDNQADIYSLGVTLYELVTGELPFEGADDRDLLRKHVQEKAIAPRDKNEDLSYEGESIIAKMMSKKKSLRYTSVDELIEDLKRRWEGKEPHSMEELGRKWECEMCETKNKITREKCSHCNEPLVKLDVEDIVLEDLE